MVLGWATGPVALGQAFVKCRGQFEIHGVISVDIFC